MLAAASEKDGWDSLVYFVLIVWALAVFLMMINHAQLQILEGYRGPLAALLGRCEQRRFEDKYAAYQQLVAAWNKQGDAFQSKGEANRQLRELLRQFPVDANDHLPTRFGNAIRAFEVYSKEIYGADSIPLWLHLSTVIPADFQTSLDDARARVNCAVNICFFAFAIGFASAICFVVGFDVKSLDNTYKTFTAMLPILHTSSFRFFSWTIGAAVICRAAYAFSIELIYAWGDLVKAAFDCYLPDLAKKLELDLPGGADARKKLWTALSEQAIYWRRLDLRKSAPAKQ